MHLIQVQDHGQLCSNQAWLRPSAPSPWGREGDAFSIDNTSMGPSQIWTYDVQPLTLFETAVDIVYSITVVLSVGPSSVWSKGPVINYGEARLHNGKIAGLKRFATPPQDRVNIFAPRPPPLKGGKFLYPPSIWLRTTPKRVFPSPLSAWLRHFPTPTPLRRCKTSHAPPSRFVAPPPPCNY